MTTPTTPLERLGDLRIDHHFKGVPLGASLAFETLVVKAGTSLEEISPYR
ncbi:MAG: hypothetical protein WA860_13520 [Acidimicrobiales bacterium]